MKPAAVTEHELHALVDGQLDSARSVAVLEWLQHHPADAARVAAWQAQRLALRQLARGQDLGETPEALTTVVLRAAGRARRRAVWQQALAAGLLLAVGLGTGAWWARHDAAAGPTVAASPAVALPPPVPAFVRDAVQAHVVYTPEKRHPVEVSAADEAHLVQWLSKRLGAPLRVPTLAGQGYQLLGGRLLPGEGTPRAQFMYEAAEAGPQAVAQRLTLYVTVFPAGRAPAAPVGFQTVREGGQTTFYWVDDRFGYALSAPAEGAGRLQEAARAVHGQLEGGGSR